MNHPHCRWSPTLGALESTSEQIWGTWPYEDEHGEIHNIQAPTVFFGIYGLPDFYTLWRHQGKRWILWAGSDITHFTNGYWLEDGGGIKLDPEPLAEWINKNCESWVENEVERQALAVMGIESQVCPSFLGDVSKFEVTYVPNDRPKVYLSVSGDNFKEYGWHFIEEIADRCEVDFYLYGNKSPWETKHHNVFVRGRVPKEVMNEEIKLMQCGLRLNEFDGFSEILAKSILWGQYPFAWASFQYPFIESFTNADELVELLNSLKDRNEPNPARSYYLKEVNKYPWVTK